MTEVIKDINLVKALHPDFLSLVKKPANQSTFKIVRNAKGDDTVATHIQRQRVLRDNPLISILFDSNMTEDDIKAMLSEFGLEGYALELSSDGSWKAYRADFKDTGQAQMKIRLSDKIVANVLKPISRAENDEITGISVVRIEFSADAFTSDSEVKEWCERNSIDFSDKAVENGDLVQVLRCVEGKFEDTRRITVDTGVTFIIARTDVTLVPPAFAEVVSETSYGNWGWGQLDFAAYLADVDLCEQGREATSALEDVIYRILYYSSLPLDVRKTLINRVTQQFADYIGVLLDSLPTQVIIATRSINEKKEIHMTTKDKGAAADTAEADAAAAAAAAANGTEGNAGQVLTRQDVEGMITSATKEISTQIASLTETIGKLAPAAAQRSDEEIAADKAKADAEALLVAEAAKNTETIVRSVATLATAVQEMNDRVKSLEGSTVVRSDGGDGTQTGNTTKRGDKVFDGMFLKDKPDDTKA